MIYNFKMKKNFFILLCLFAFEKISADYAGPNGNAYGVPSDSFKPPPSGPYPPSGWKPAGRRLVLPGESRNGYHPIGTDYGQPPPSQYGPSVDNTFPPNNQYIPGTSISGPSGNGNGFSSNGQNGNGNGLNGNGNGQRGNGHNGNGHNGNGHNGNGHNGNGHNGNGHNGNGHNGNGHNGNGHNGNGHNGNGFPTGNGHNGNGFPTGNGHNGNGFPTGNGHNGNGFPTGNGHNGNGFPTGNGHNGNGFSTGNGHNGNGFPTGNGHNGNGNNKNGVSNGGNGLHNNGHNGNGGSQNSNGVPGNGKIPTFLTSGPGLVYPFIQVSVPSTVAAVRPGPGLGIGSGNIYPIFHVPSHNHAHPNIGIFTSLDPRTGLTYGSGFPTTATASTVSDLSNVLHISQGNSQDLRAALPTFFGHTGEQIIGNGIGHYYSNSLLQKSNLLAAKNGLNSLQLQYTVGHPSHGNLGVPLNV